MLGKMSWWTTWSWSPEVLLVLLLLASVYTAGWWRLRCQGHRRLASGWRLAAHAGGVGVLALALVSPVDTLGDYLFSAHMVQHELLMMVAPPLLLLGNPFPVALWGMPRGLRWAIGRLMDRRGRFRQWLRHVSAPGMAWLLYVSTLWLWHTPAAYDAALRYEFVHTLEHISFFATALLFWWHVIGTPPHVHGKLGYGRRVGYVLAALAQNEVLAVGISLAREPLYLYYTTVPRIWGLSVLEDQMLGGTIMWIPGGMMYALVAIILIARWWDREEKTEKLTGQAIPRR